MNKKTLLKYSIVLPAHNEEKFIGNALSSITNQSLLPQEVIVVNDNSTDRTEEIILKFAEKHPFIKYIHSQNTSTEHLPGSKIVQAFYKGFECLENEWEIIVKLDADVVLPSDYFEKLILVFNSNPKIGVAGGLAMVEENGQWTYEKIGNKKQVRGPFKAYSKDCFEKIGGLKKSIGWDTADELLAMYYGFEIKVLPDLKVKLLKPTGTVYNTIHGRKIGQSFYRLDYQFSISLIAALKASWNKKSFKLFIEISKGYWNSVFQSDDKIVSSSEGKFIRKFRWKGITDKLLFRS